METPLVSIILSTYNRANIIRKTLDSLLSQTYENFELLISINGSKDNTIDVLSEYSSRDKRIRVISNQENIGLGRNLNKLISYSNPQSKYIAIAEDDDWYYPYRLEKEVEFLESQPDYGMVSGIAEFVSKDRTTLFPGILVHSQYPDNKIEMFKLNYREQTKVVHTCIMFRRDVHIDNGLYFSQHFSVISVDLIYFLRFALVAKIGGLKIPLARLDRGEQRGSATENKKSQFRVQRHYIHNIFWELEGKGVLTKKDKKYAMNTQYNMEGRYFGGWRTMSSFLMMVLTDISDPRIVSLFEYWWDRALKKYRLRAR